MPATDYIGVKFGLLTLRRELAPIQDKRGKRVRLFEAACECGGMSVVRLGNVRSGNTTSCGCMKYSGIERSNAKASIPQTWTVDGGAAYIEIKGRRVLVDASDVALVSQYRWHMNEAGYVASMNRGNRVSMHRLIMGLANGDPREVDHRDRKPRDNRRSELRIATSAQNKMNRGKKTGSTSQFKGVSWDAPRGKWKAQIKIGERPRYIGRFSSEEEAAAAYDREAAKAFGEFAFLNQQNDGGQHACNCN